MRHFACLIGFLFVFSSVLFAQVEITPKKVIYIRTGQDVPDFKRTFEVRYPMVSGIKSKQALSRMENALDYWRVFEMSLEENRGDEHWLTSFDYKVNYNRHSILEIELIMQGVGAYPDGTVKTLVIDQRTGRRVRVPDVFENIGGLLVKIEKSQDQEIAAAIANAKTEFPEDSITLEEMLGGTDYSIKTLDEYSVSEKGVTFLFDYGFPHVIQAMEPEGRYFFTWKEISGHVKPRGLLGRFIAK